MKEICLISFLTDKFLYPCVSFVSLSLLSLTMLLFKIFNDNFLHLLIGYFDMRFRDSRYNRHNARVRLVRKSCFLISKILTCFFLFQIIQQCDMLYLDCYWISCELAKISMVEKLISKELVNPYGLYDNSLLMVAPPHMAILPG